MGLLKEFEGFTLWSENYKELAKWYQDFFELEIALEIDVPEDHAIALKVDPNSTMYLWIGSHSEVKGINKDPYRIMISYIVEDVEGIHAKAIQNSVKVIAEPHISPDGELNVLTLMDPQDNLIQLFEKI